MGSLNNDLTRDLKNKYSNVGFEELLKIKDESVLAEIAKNNSNILVCLEAVKIINSESFLADVVTNSSNKYIRIEAVKKINDGTVLANLIKNDSDDDVRYAAIKNINNETVLADIAKNDSDADVRYAAIKNINNETVLADIAKTSFDNRVSLEAYMKIKDDSVLTDIFKYWGQQEEVYDIFKEYDVKPNYLQTIAEVDTNCRNFTVIAKIIDIFGSVNKISGIEKRSSHCFIRIKDNSKIRMIIKEDELKHIQIGNYYIMTHIDCGKYNGTKKLRTTANTTFTPISETEAKKIMSHFPKKKPDWITESLDDEYNDFDNFDNFEYYDPYDGFSEAPETGLYCRKGDRWDYGNI